MSNSNENPVALAGAHRVEDIAALLSNSDPQIDTSSKHETPAVRAFVRRLGLPLATARVICELAGIGGAE